MSYFSWTYNIDYNNSFNRDQNWRFLAWNFNFMPFRTYNLPIINYRQEPSCKEVKPEKRPPSSNDFDKMLAFVLRTEGGYTSNDCGQAGNKGIRQSTYDNYRKKKGLATQPVKYITDIEVRDIYYNDYFVASGANKIQDSKLTMYTFDTAVNMGVKASKKILKQSNNDLNKFEDMRIARYESIAENNPEKAKYLK